MEKTSAPDCKTDLLYKTSTTTELNTVSNKNFKGFWGCLLCNYDSIDSLAVIYIHAHNTTTQIILWTHNSSVCVTSCISSNMNLLSTSIHTLPLLQAGPLLQYIACDGTKKMLAKKLREEQCKQELIYHEVLTCTHHYHEAL